MEQSIDLAAKDKSPDYSVLRGSVPKDLALRFKQLCLEEELDYSEGLEKVLTIFFEIRDAPPSPTTSKKGD